MSDVAKAIPAAPKQGPAELEMPMRFGKYTLIRKLATGGMAELFLALQRSVAGFEKLIVVKRVLPHLVKDDSFIEMLLAEARIAATLNHPNVAHIYDVGEVDGQYYIAMEHVHGEDLRSIVRQMKKMNVTAFPLEHALAIVLGCCAGLAFAHEQRDLDGEPMGIVHRDVSPQNILVTFSGDVKLVDFGIAKAGRSKEEDTGSGQLKGKVPYMSPEQAQGLHLDNRSDVFSLGIMLFELCTGRRLFRGKNEMETLRRIVEDEYPRPRELNPHLNPRLEAIILRALEKSTKNRYQTAREMQADLEDFIRDEQLKVSSLSVGEWMGSLFKDKLDAQKEMLQEGRQLADVIAAQVAEEEAREGSLSGVRQKQASKAPWILLGLVMLVTAGAAAFLLTRPPPEPVAAHAPGVIQVSSTPDGAAIWIDGDRRSERTPAAIEHLPIGATYSVKLTQSGFAPHVERVELTEDAPQQQLDITLQRPDASNFAVVRVRTVPAGAHVLLDGRDTGQVTPATVPEVTPVERHTLALALDGYETRNETLSLEAGQVAELSFELERRPLAENESILRVTTEPQTARLRFDGQWHDEGSPYEFRVPTRRYTINVEAPGFRDHEQSVALEGGEASEVEVTLTERRIQGGRRPPPPDNGTVTPPVNNDPGRLTFNSTPWCNVSIDGRNAGQTPVVNFQLSAGRHTIVCTNPTAGTQRVTVNIPPGQTVRRAITLQ
ncbi:MAG: PEGA domain-containing protein [Sandaracinaceae bacterium]